MTSLFTVSLFIYLICRAHHADAGLDESQGGIKTARSNVNSLRRTDDNTLMAESKEEPRSRLTSVQEDSERARVKDDIEN